MGIKMGKEIDISMIVPIYKGKKYIQRIIRMFEENCSRLRQYDEGLSAELILVNDYPEEQIELPKPDCAEYDVSIIVNKSNIGIHKTKIEGLKYARGEYVFFLDQDDLISPHYFVEQYKAIGECDASVCNVDIGEGPYYSKSGVEALDLSIYLSGYNGIFSLGQVLFRKDRIPVEWIKKPLRKNGADDYYLLFIMLLKKQKMVEHRKTLYYHVYTGENLSTNSEAMDMSVEELLGNLVSMELLTNKQMEDANRNRDCESRRRLARREKYSESMWDERVEHIRTIRIYDKCLCNLELSYAVDSYISTFGCNRIAVYGAGKMGKHFLYWMRISKKVLVEVCIDQKKSGQILGIPVIQIEDAKEQKDKFDMIVVTPISGTKRIIEELEQIFDCTIISLEEVVCNMSCALLETAHRSPEYIYIVN